LAPQPSLCLDPASLQQILQATMLSLDAVQFVSGGVSLLDGPSCAARLLVQQGLERESGLKMALKMAFECVWKGL